MSKKNRKKATRKAAEAMAAFQKRAAARANVSCVVATPTIFAEFSAKIAEAETARVAERVEAACREWRATHWKRLKVPSGTSLAAVLKEAGVM